MAIAQLSIDLVAKVADFERDLKRATTATQKQTKLMADSFEFAKGAMIGLSGALSVGVFASAVKDVANYADGLGKMAQRVGVTVEALSGLSYAASLSDVSNEQLGTGLKKLAKIMQEAAGGMDQQKRVLKELGVTTTTDVNKAFAELADRFAGMEDGAGKTAAAMAVFGKSGADMIPLLNGGAEGLNKATEEARQFGLIVGGEAAKAAELFNDNLTRLEALAKGAKVELFGDWIIGIGHMTTAFLKASAEGNKFKGILDAINALFNGDDKHKSNVRMVDLTDELLKLEGDISKLTGRRGDDAARMLKYAQDRLVVVKEEIQTTLNFRKVLFEDENKQKPKTGKVDSSIFNTGGAKKTVDDSVRLALDEATRVARIRSDARNKEYEEINKFHTDQLNAEDKFWRDLLAATPTAQLEEQRKVVEKITAGFLAGRFGDVDSAQAAATYGEVINTYLNNIPASVEASKDAANELGLVFASAFEDAIVNGKELSTVLDGIIKDIARITIRRTVTEPLDKYLTGMLGGLFSFDGGGSTPNGARSGGVDGRGGFLSVLHPNETIIDHTKGQKSGGSVTVYQNFTVGDVASISMVRQAVMGSERRIASAMSRSMNYGGVMA